MGVREGRRGSGRRRRSSPLRWPCSPAATPARALPPRPAPVSPAVSNHEPELAVWAAHLPPRATCWRGPCGVAASPARRSAVKTLRRRSSGWAAGVPRRGRSCAVGAPDGVGLPDEVAVRRVAHVHRVAAPRTATVSAERGGWRSAGGRPGPRPHAAAGDEPHPAIITGRQSDGESDILKPV